MRGKELVEDDVVGAEIGRDEGYGDVERGEGVTVTESKLKMGQPEHSAGRYHSSLPCLCLCHMSVIMNSIYTAVWTLPGEVTERT